MFATEVVSVKEVSTGSPGESEYYDQTEQSTQMTLKLVEQGVGRHERHFIGKPPVNINNIERMYSGGGSVMFALTYPDRTGNRTLLTSGGDVKFGW